LENGKAMTKYVFKLIANLSLDDSTTITFFQYFDWVLSSANTDDAELLGSCLMILGNLARSDEHCTKMMNSQELVPLLLKSLHNKDLRNVHLSVGALHNLSIPVQNKVPLMKAGILPLLVEILKNKEQPNPLIQYSIAGTLKSLVVVGDEMTTEFVKEGGLAILVQLANGELNPKIPPNEEDEEEEKKEKKEPDKRVQYEAARVLVRFTDRVEYAKEIAALGGIPSILDLITTKFNILQAEGVKAILQFAQIVELKEILLQSKTLEILENLHNDDEKVIEAISNIRIILN